MSGLQINSERFWIFQSDLSKSEQIKLQLSQASKHLIAVTFGVRIQFLQENYPHSFSHVS